MAFKEVSLADIGLVFMLVGFGMLLMSGAIAVLVTVL